MNKDLTVGKPSQVLWQFCLPMFGSIIFQLRDHPDLHCICLWLQHWLLGHRVPLLWRKGLR